MCNFFTKIGHTCHLTWMNRVRFALYTKLTMIPQVGKKAQICSTKLWILCFPFTIWLFLQRHVEPDISLSLSTSYLMFFKTSVHSKAWDGIDCGFWYRHIQALILVIENVNFQISGQLWNARHMIFRYLDNNEMLNIFRYGESQNASRVWGSWSLNAIHFGGFWEHICNICAKLFAFQEKDENIDNGKHPEEEEVSVEMLKKNWN